MPLTGGLAHVGEDIRRGITLGQQDFSDEQLGFEVLYEDNRHEPKLAVTTATKLLQRDMSDVVAPLAERARVPHLAIRWNPHVTKEHAFTFTMESTYLSYVDSQIELVKELGASSISILTEAGEGWILAATYLKRIAPKHGIQVLSEEQLLRSEHDHRAIIERTLRKEPDLIVIFTNPPVTQMVLKRLRERAPQQRFTGNFEVLSDPGLVEGVPFVAQFLAAPWFELRFKNVFGERYQVRAPQAYDLMLLLRLAATLDGGPSSGSDLVAALTSIDSFFGATGQVSINADRNIESECVWLVARNGRFRALEDRLAESN